MRTRRFVHRLSVRLEILAALAIPSLAFSAPIDVELLTPLATGVFANGGIAARAGFVYVYDNSGVAGMNSRVFRIGPDGSVEQDWLTGVVSGSKPYIGSNGALWLIGNDFDNGPPQRYIPRIDTFEPQTGASLGPLHVEGSISLWATSVTELQDGSIVFGTDGTGIRKVVSSDASVVLSFGFGGNAFVATAPDGRILLASGPVFGVIDGNGQFNEVVRTPDWISSVVPLPDGTILLANRNFLYSSETSVWRLSADFTTLTQFMTVARHPPYSTAFVSLTLDAVRDEIVALTGNGNVYVVPVPDGTVGVEPVTWGTLKTLFR